MKYFLTTLTFLFSSHAFSQSLVEGKILSEKKQPIAGASISIVDTYDGTTSDSAGNFKFQTIESGLHTLSVSAIGYQETTDTITLNGGTINKIFYLISKTKSMDAVVITAGTFEAGDQNRATELTSLDIVTTASANGDVTSAMKTLPGTQQVGESEGLFVRGGTADESKIYIDGTIVNRFFYTSEPGRATRGRFNPFLFKGTVFSTGGYSALYGQALSSVLLLESIDLPDRTSASLNASVLSVGGGIQKLSDNKKSSWGINYGYSNLALIFSFLKQNAEYSKPPVAHELDVNLRTKTVGSGMLKYYGYLNFSDLAFSHQDADSMGLRNAFNLKNSNIYQNLSWRGKLGGGWKLRTGLSYSNNNDNIRNQLKNEQKETVPPLNNPIYDSKVFSIKNIGNYWNGRFTIEKNLSGLSALRFGTEFLYSHDQLKFNGIQSVTYDSKLSETLWAPYIESDIYILSKLALRSGLRAEHSQLFDKWNIAPRLSLAYQFQDKGQVSLAYGIFYQNPDNKYLPSINRLHFEKATHYILQYQKMANQRLLRIETFYKKYDDLIKAVGGYGKLTAINNKGFGDAAGAELFWRDKKSIRNFDYWISYSYLDTKRDFLNYPYKLRPPFSSKHTASLVTKLLLLSFKMQVNASYVFASGRPYYDLYSLNNGGTSQNFKIRSEGVTKNYNDLSLSLNYLPQLGKKKAKAFSVIVFSVSNVPGFNNVYTYQFSANGAHKTAITPPFKRFYYLGYFVSFGIDRTQEAIDSQL